MKKNEFQNRRDFRFGCTSISLDPSLVTAEGIANAKNQLRSAGAATGDYVDHRIGERLILADSEMAKELQAQADAQYAIARNATQEANRLVALANFHYRRADRVAADLAVVAIGFERATLAARAAEKGRKRK